METDKRLVVVKGCRTEGLDTQITECFEDSEITVYGAVMINTSHSAQFSCI